jgi:predicted alpha/beta-fold hydrolase
MHTGELILPPTDYVYTGRRQTISAKQAGDLAGAIAGHFWTIVPALRAAILPPAAPAARPFQATVADPGVGAVRLSGWLSEAPESETLVLIVHGLAGSATSPYCVAAARAARQAGYSSLRLSMRGADGSGEDIYHGGLTADLRAALASPTLTRYQRIFLLGYSFGGHLALRAGIEQIDPRLRAIAAICPPLDLAATMNACDVPSRRLYRWAIKHGLNQCYARTAARGRAPNPLKRLRRTRFCGEWNALAIVPRFGFKNLQDYYERASVATDIHRLHTSSLIVANRNDPIVSPETLSPALAKAARAVTVRWVARGGHLYFPADLDLGQGGRLGLEAQVLRWLGRQ